ncbi:hypothetical protein [Marivita sp. GX14005]|uniref:hypothetical protein n=1 Tax=Marivita sp. GX14005 TaxID=2942276 RepID=UPI0020195C77|nr:hypothetical protein [Marivita sp. GX14005]MCL3883206.1 hypothetical protein [Marivita sp. GX14005]
MKIQSDAYPAHVRAFSRLLIRLRAELGNDLDQVLILAVVAERYYAAIEAAPCTDPPETRGINAYSVALYTDIPRETVRRKVKLLVEKGWLDCDGRGHLTPTEQAARDLQDGTAATLDYIRAIAR